MPQALLLVTLLMIGCASPGPPRPPSLHLPALVQNLQATRTGNEVLLRWTTPSQTTDGLELKGETTAKICRIIANSRSTASQGGQGTVCDPVLRVVVRPGDSLVTTSLEEILRADPIVLLTYRIELVNPLGRSAGMSAPGYASSGTAPPAVAGLRVRPSPGGAVLEWRREPGGNLVELHRVSDQPPVTAAARPVPPQSKTVESPDVLLRAGETPGTGSKGAGGDSAGTIDHGARSGESYRYVASRIRQVEAGGQALEIRSGSSPEVRVAMKDLFPPRSPGGLVSVVNPSVGDSPTVDLSWQPDTEADLAGYIVYRRVAGTVAGGLQRLTAAPILVPAYQDRTVARGQTYEYSVSAIDKAGNESAASGEVEEKVELP